MTDSDDSNRLIARKRGPMREEEKPLVQDNFLKAFAVSGNVRQACLRAGVDRSTIYAWKRDDEAFAERYKLAEDDVNDRLRAEMWRRAMKGVRKPVYQGGKQVGFIREYSDGLISLLAKAHMPEFRQAGVSGEEGRREYVGVNIEEV
jgi:hypothetical protein